MPGSPLTEDIDVAFEQSYSGPRNSDQAIS
jgi:hypothetical protein